MCVNVSGLFTDQWLICNVCLVFCFGEVDHLLCELYVVGLFVCEIWDQVQQGHQLCPCLCQMRYYNFHEPFTLHLSVNRIVLHIRNHTVKQFNNVSMCA